MKTLKVNKIAKTVGVTHSAVSQWLSGKTNPDIKNIFLMKDKFGIPLNAWRDIRSYINNTKSKEATTSLQKDVS